ncbi:proline dehydrogenase family protein [Paenibacillus koleovorans]|uniref:proline dehydrogenase family protein n=1 Tax=Paenibacillus koleovorans TaxID=121608 RepID=UPI000FDCB140|nr:proline dehydrogenase family protein [Paenibacillus koleovorans]
MESLMRSTLLFLSRNKWANRAAKKYGLRLGASRFVAGVELEEALDSVRRLNAQGIAATLDHLGEFISTPEEAKEATSYCLSTLDAIHEAKVESHLSLKLTQLGLDLSRELCLANMRSILSRARQYGNFVRIDMEDYSHNQPALDLFRQLREEFGPNVIGIVIQAYLYKSRADIEKLKPLAPNLRLVKGAYKERPAVAFPKKEDVDRNFIAIIERHMLNGHYTAVATHDEAIIRHVKKFTARRGIPKTRFEFQMLYGISVRQQQQLAAEGYKMRVYVPFGRDWYGYFMRRLAERPANVGFVVKSMFRK